MDCRGEVRRGECEQLALDRERSPWTRETYDSLFKGLTVVQSNVGKVVIDSMGTVQGEACTNNRKARLIYI